jgi:deoxyguanosine kinase
MNQSGKYIVIEGNIGAGKTTLAGMLSTEWNAKLVLEQFSDNPFLPGFYADPSKYAFPLELSFLAERYQQMKDVFAVPDLFKPWVVADYFIYKSRIFASHNLPELEFELFGKLFDIIDNALPKPDILLYLYAGVPQLLENIKKRGRSYEQQISKDYLTGIQQYYIEHLKKVTDFPVILVDVTGKDFVADVSYYQSISKMLTHEHPSGFRVREI